MNLDPTGRRSAIEAALLEYHRSPGQYSLINREPALLFSCLTEVLQLASGRSPDGALEPGPVKPVQQAACFFIRSGLLYPTADHYALLGLTRSADPAAIKDRYRLLMRLIHPDFSGTVAGANWPADAATRVNQSHAVLSSPVQRGLYDRTLDAAAAPPHPRTHSQPSTGFRSSPGPTAADNNPRSRLKGLAAVFGVLGTAALVALVVVSGASQTENLVQRPPAPSLTPVAAALPEVAFTEPDTSQASNPPQAEAPPQPLASVPKRELVARVPEGAATPPALASSMQGQSMPVLKGLAPPARQSEPAAVVSVYSAVSPIDASPPPPPPPLAPAPAPAPAPPAVAVTGTAPMPAKDKPRPGPTLDEAHPLLSKLLQYMESGGGDRVLSMLDRDARSTPAAQALLQQYNSLVGGGGPVKLSNVHFKAEPHDDRLLVTGYVTLEVGERTARTVGKDFSVQAEFAQRDGAVVMTRLSRAPAPGGERAQ